MPRPERRDPAARVGPRARLPARPHEERGGTEAGTSRHPAAAPRCPPAGSGAAEGAAAPRRRRANARGAASRSALPRGRARRLPGAVGGRPRERGARGGSGRAAAGRGARGRRCGAEQPPQNSASRRRPAPSTHFYICAPFQSSVTCPAPRPIGGALWSGQWKGPGQSARRLAWRQPMGTGLC